ncbi:arylesterase [Thiohalomonas denitrificans]|uniref:arylesterase n=1 Tax=Thiohalomonas denitrificans TaxID=415747 RepID=UPI0026ED1F7A|nr:arylesterase [Thiohalomonas denitrificans]
MREPCNNVIRGFRSGAVVFAAVLLLFACGEQPQLLPLHQDATILAFGDSLTYGTGAAPEESYPAVLGRLIGRRVVNAGAPGELSHEGLKRLPNLLEQHQPVLLLLCHGGNDLLRKQDGDRLADNLREMIEIARARGIEVVLLGVPGPKLFLMKSEPLYSDIATTMQVPLEPDIIPAVESDEELKSDRIHPNAAGYRLVAEAVAELLHEAGAITR